MKVTQQIRRTSLFERVLRPAKLRTMAVEEVHIPDDVEDVAAMCVRFETAALIRAADKAESERVTTTLRRSHMLSVLNVPSGFALLANPTHVSWIIENLPVETPRGRADARLLGLDVHAVADISRIYVLRHDPGFFDRKAMRDRVHRFKLFLRDNVRVIEVEA